MIVRHRRLGVLTLGVTWTYRMAVTPRQYLKIHVSLTSESHACLTGRTETRWF